MKIEFSEQIIEKSSNVKFRRNPSSESRVVSYGRTDGRDHDEAQGIPFAVYNFTYLTV